LTDELSTKPRTGKPALSSEPLPLSVGSILDGRFVIESMLGAGGMGYVVLARNVDLEERVAIKLLLPGRADDDARQRLVREARAAVKIKSDHVVRILDVVSTGPNAPYIVMEHLEGEDLAQRLARKGALEPGEVAEIVLQACEAVGEAHHRGMAHRDLKPSNLFLVSKPGQPRFVKVLDFGISKALDGGNERLTASNAMLGSPAYAAPEQLRDSRSVDRRCDVWALGVVLYECLTNELPFGGSNIGEICTRILEGPPAPPPPDRPILEALRSIIDRCLEKDPGFRYDNVGELASALREFAPIAAQKSMGYLTALGPALPALPKADPSAVRGPRLAGALARTEAAQTAQGQTFDTRQSVTRRRPMTLAILALTAAAGAATFFAVRRAPPHASVGSEPASNAPPVASVAPAVPSVSPVATPTVLDAFPPAASGVENTAPSPSASVTPRTPGPLTHKPARKSAGKPVKSPKNDTTPGAAWVDSR